MVMDRTDDCNSCRYEKRSDIPLALARLTVQLAVISLLSAVL